MNDLNYIPMKNGMTPEMMKMQPKVSRKMQIEVYEVNMRDIRAEKRRKVIAILTSVGLAAFVVTSFYFFACALFTYGASW